MAIAKNQIKYWNDSHYQFIQEKVSKVFLRPLLECCGASDETLTTLKCYCNYFKEFWKPLVKKSIKTTAAQIIWSGTEVETRIAPVADVYAEISDEKW